MDPRRLGPQDLVVSHFSLARDHPLDERLEAAAAAGFAGIGLFLGQWKRLKDGGMTTRQLRQALERHGLCLAELEVVRLQRDPAAEALAWELAGEVGARYVQVIGPHGTTVGEAAEAFAAVCDQAARFDLVCGIEFLPFTDVRTAAEALAIAEHAGRANGGVCVDVWHHVRGANDLALVDAVPAHRVMAIQLSDGTQRPALDDYLWDCLTTRVPPGEGEMEVAAFVHRLRDRGVKVPLSAEVCNDDVWGRPAGPWLARLAAGLRSVDAAPAA